MHSAIMFFSLKWVDLLQFEQSQNTLGLIFARWFVDARQSEGCWSLKYLAF